MPEGSRALLQRRLVGLAAALLKGLAWTLPDQAVDRRRRDQDHSSRPPAPVLLHRPDGAGGTIHCLEDPCSIDAGLAAMLPDGRERILGGRPNGLAELRRWHHNGGLERRTRTIAEREESSHR